MTYVYYNIIMLRYNTAFTYSYIISEPFIPFEALRSKLIENTAAIRCIHDLMFKM